MSGGLAFRFISRGRPWSAVEGGVVMDADNRQAKPETRRKQSDSQLELLCVNCNGLLSADDGSTYCRECKPWLVGAQPGRAGRGRTRIVRSQRRK
jgi:hypothetical protein